MSKEQKLRKELKGALSEIKDSEMYALKKGMQYGEVFEGVKRRVFGRAGMQTTKQRKSG